ncbi:MAG: helix-hairpin-helix domain-containing protein [bacterium]
MTFSNAAISDMFTLLSKLMDIHQENSFKSKSYSSAAYAIDKLSEELQHIQREKLFNLKGIGESSAKKIIEILDSGRMAQLDELIGRTPEGVLEMLQIKGLGPKKISTIWKEMGIETLGELLYACNENRLLLYKGFGEKTQQNVADSIEFYLRNQGHFLYAEIEEYAHAFQETLKKQFTECTFVLCGEFVRQQPTIETIEWVTNIQSSILIDFLANNGFVVEFSDDKKIVVRGNENVGLVFNFSTNNDFHKTVFLLNGSEDFINSWKEQYPASLVQPTSEEDIFKIASVNYIPVCQREEKDIIQLASKKSLSNTIRTEDIKGIIHSHSDWSDGVNKIDDMAKACINRGFEYLVISDHSKSAFYANGLSEERIKQQHLFIDELNKKFSPFKIFKSIESDILNDGSLDYSPSLLGTFDLVIASVHSNLKMSEEKAMQRVMTAIENPYTTILGHPTGRLLLSRKGYPLDHERIIDACIANRVAIEINAHPRRLDLDWRWIRKAQEKGAMLSINPDAHNTEGYNDIRYGVLAAQKGGLQKNNNLSSLSLAEFEQYLSNVRRY